MPSAAEKFVKALRQTQWLHPADLVRYQRPLLDRMVRHAAAQTSFYSERLAPLFAGAAPASAPVDWSRWLQVPILRRADLMANVSALEARSVPDSAGRSAVRRSSGTTGKSLEYRRSAIAAFVGNCMLHRVFEVFDFDLEGTLADITHDESGRSDYPDGSVRRGWHMLGRSGRACVLEVLTPAAEQLDWLERMRPDYVMTYANDLWAVAEVARRRGGSPLRFKAFVSAGEMLEAAARTAIAEAFGCQVIDVYGSREFGPLAFECPVGTGYHVCSESVLFELLDDAGKPVGPGEEGRVVVTSLYNFAMPFIRYDLGDYAVAGDAPCPCGRGLPTIKRVAGRARHLFVMPDGSRMWPRVGMLWEPLTRMLPYREVQLVQTAVDALEVRYIPASGGPPDVAGIEAIMRAEFHPALKVTLVPVEQIARPGRKSEMFVSQVAV